MGRTLIHSGGNSQWQVNGRKIGTFGPLDSASSRSVLARRLRLLTKKLVESSTDVRMPRFRKNLASQKPSYPASKQTTISAGRPSICAASACVPFNIATSASVSPPRTWRSFTRSELGESTATSHVDLLSSMAAYTDTMDLAFSFIGGLLVVDEADEPGSSSIASITKSIPIPGSRWLPLGSSSGLNQSSRLVR